MRKYIQFIVEIGYTKNLNDLPDTPTSFLPSGLIPEISCIPSSPQGNRTLPTTTPNVATYASTLAVNKNGY